MGPDVPLDLIIKKFTIIYGNVKSFDLMMRDFCRADQGEDESIPSYVTRIEGLLSQIRDRFPDQLPLQEEQRLLKDCLFHGSRKGIRDSLKYCFANASIDYMQFLEECRKSEEEGKAGQARSTKGIPPVCYMQVQIKSTIISDLDKPTRYRQVLYVPCYQ